MNAIPTYTISVNAQQAAFLRDALAQAAVPVKLAHDAATLHDQVLAACKALGDPVSGQNGATE